MLVKDIRAGGRRLAAVRADHGRRHALFLGQRRQRRFHGSELWKSDGTEAGTTLVKDIRAGSGGSGPVNLTAVGSTLFFSADDGVQSAASCGSRTGRTAGTTLVKDIHPAAGNADPAELTVVGTRLYFTATDPVHSRELWTSDGTTDGTFLVEDIRPGTNTSFLQGLTAVGNTLYFSSTDAVDGWELRSVDDPAAGTTVTKLLPGPMSGFSPSRPAGTDAAAPRFVLTNGKVLFPGNFGGGQGTELFALVDPVAPAGPVSPPADPPVTGGVPVSPVVTVPAVPAPAPVAAQPVVTPPAAPVTVKAAVAARLNLSSSLVVKNGAVAISVTCPAATGLQRQLPAHGGREGEDRRARDAQAGHAEARREGPRADRRAQRARQVPGAARRGREDAAGHSGVRDDELGRREDDGEGAPSRCGSRACPRRPRRAARRAPMPPR